MSPFPKCPVCKHPHQAGSGHIWEDATDTAAIAQSVEREPSKLDARVRPSLAAPPLTLEDITGEVETMLECIDQAKTPFDRKLYQRQYMRDLPKARAEGLTVKMWREKHKND